MKGKLISLMVSGLVLGLSCQAANAEFKDYTNEYFAGGTAPARTIVVKTGQSGLSGSSMVEKTISSPVVVPGAPNQQPFVIEDRIVKKKHLFGVGIWPLFNLEVL